MSDLLTVIRIFQIMLCIVLIIVIQSPVGILLFICYFLTELLITIIKCKLVRKETLNFKRLIKQLFSI